MILPHHYSVVKRTILLSFIFLLTDVCFSFGVTSSVTNVSSGVTINADYCSAGAGNVLLSATSGFSSYKWNTGATTSSITVHQAGLYLVTVTDALANIYTATINVGGELVTNGDFSAGNKDFSTDYQNNQSSLIVEGTYAITTNANTQHPYFHGTDHTNPGIGNFMAINGNTVSGITVWQQVIKVIPNTTYYFSTWAMGISSYSDPTDRQASLQFSINGIVLGTPFQVTPYSWKQFYIPWYSGSQNSATIKIIDLQTAVGGNDFGIDDISFSTLSPDVLSVSPSNNTPVCEGSVVNLFANPMTGAMPLSYFWEGPNGFTSTNQNPVLSNATNSMSGAYHVTVTYAGGCTASGTTNVVVNALPEGILGNDGSTCSIGTANLLFTATAGVGPFDLVINGKTYSNIVSGDTINVKPGSTKTYTLTSITDKGINNSCSHEVNVSTTVIVSDIPDWECLITGNPTFCVGDSTTLTTVGDAVSYHWSTGDTTASITVKKTGLYSVTGTNRRGCEKLATINVEEEPFPLINFKITPTTINNKDNTVECSISPQDNVSYLWDLGDNTTDTRTTFTHLYHLNSETASFTVKLTAINSVTGCVNNSASRVITVEPFVPNVFSPNWDGINDYFMPNYDMQVFDRNGILLYQGNKDSKGWDGTYKGENVDTDTYFYVLHYSNANQQIVTKKGYVTLIR